MTDKTCALYADALAGASPQEIQKRYSDTIEAAIAKTKASGELERVRAPDLAEAYAYPHPHGVAWGVDDFEGFNVLRGIRRPDGTDFAMT